MTILERAMKEAALFSKIEDKDTHKIYPFRKSVTILETGAVHCDYCKDEITGNSAQYKPFNLIFESPNQTNICCYGECWTKRKNILSYGEQIHGQPSPLGLGVYAGSFNHELVCLS
jgi:hypothetical protein